MMPDSVILKVEGLSKSFGGIRAVDGCSFVVEKGKITALIGPNGAGKSTLFNLVSGFVIQDAGMVEFQGMRIEHMPAYRRARRGIARTFQQVRLFQNLTLEDNIEIAQEANDSSFWISVIKGRGAIDRARTNVGAYGHTPVQEALERIGIDRTPNTLASELSFGQQKLLELARALEFPHQLLMLDEPVAGVAPHLREQFLGLFRKLKAEGETILLIEHDMDFVMQLADIVVVMDEGKVLMKGTPEEVRKHEGVLEAYLGQQL
jgi:branched-chain amino acid transport system ATP-binding protein